MKTILTILLLSIVTISVEAQDWVHQGSVWHYEWVTFNYGGYKECRYTKDTVVANQSCHQISAIAYATPAFPPRIDTIPFPFIYTYSNRDTTFFFYQQISRWLPVYFFNAQVGDTINIPNGPSPYALNRDTIVPAIVDTVSKMIVNSDTLRYYSFHLRDSCNVASVRGRVQERIGMLDNDMMPFWDCFMEGYWTPIRCYQDDSFALYPAGTNCTYIYTGINDIASNTFSIYPIPRRMRSTSI